jgi:predicted dehydrogenase
VPASSRANIGERREQKQHYTESRRLHREDYIVSILLLGACGFAGRFHQAAYAKLGITDLTLVDPIEIEGHHLGIDRLRNSVNWQEVIVDVCVPTSLHTTVISTLASLGARRFIVEKPAAESADEWRRLLAQTPDSLFFHVNNYLFSGAFNAALNYITTRKLRPNYILSSFNKDRRAHSLRGRGADPAGNLPHVFKIELPHQLGLALALFPSALVCDAWTRPMTLAMREIDDHGSGTVILKYNSCQVAKLQTDLQLQISRQLFIGCTDGTLISVQFATDHSFLARAETLSSPVDSREVLFHSPDVSLNKTLELALSIFRGEGTVPYFASNAFALHVLEQIDDAIRLASGPNIWRRRRCCSQRDRYYVPPAGLVLRESSS